MDLPANASISAGIRWPRPSRGTIVVTTLLVAYLALTVAVVTRSPVLRVDTDVLHWDLHRRYPQWWKAINDYEVIGQRGPSTLVALPWLIWRSWRSRSLRPLVLVATALILLNLSVGVVKVFVGRLGPLATSDAYLPFHGGDIFPSGHTSNAVVLYGALAMLAQEHRRLMTGVAVFLAATVGLFTLYLDTHWVTDVLGGWLAGGLVLLATPRASAWATTHVEALVRRWPALWARRLTRDQMVTYISRYGRGVSGAGRSHPTQPARRTVPRGRTDVGRPGSAVRYHPLRGHEAPQGPGGSRPRRHQTSRPGEVALPQRRAHPAALRTVGEQVRRPVGR